MKKAHVITPIAATLFLLSLYLLTFKGTSHSTDEWLFIQQMGKVLVEGFSRPARFYVSYYALLLPFLSLSRIVPHIGSYQVLTVWNVLSTATNGLLVYLILEELGYSRLVSLAVGMTYGVGTQAWPYSNYLLREPTGAMWALIAALFAIRLRRSNFGKNLAASLTLLALGVLTKKALTVLVPFYLAYLAIKAYKTNSMYKIRKSKTTTWMLSAISIFSISILVYVLHRYYYLPIPHKLSDLLPNWKTGIAMFVSPGWGLLLFSPVLALIFIGIPGFVKKNPLDGTFLLSLPWLYFIGMSHHPLWWGTWNWGPRQVNPVLPLFILPLAEVYVLAGRKPWLKAVIAALFTAGAALAAMQALVSYPFYQEAFKKGLTPQRFMWTWKASPALNQWRFVKLSNLEVAWGYKGSIKWGLLSLDLITLCAAGWLLRKAVKGTIGSRKSIPVILALTAALILEVGITLVASYRSPAYGGNIGFPEAAETLHRGWQEGDALVIYMWGDPPEAYIPKVAMLNYCKGSCLNQISVIKEQFIDGHPSWEKNLWRHLSQSDIAWLIEQKIKEDAPERPVEFALARKMYFVNSRWTGPEVRLLLFDKGDHASTIAHQRAETRYFHEDLVSYSVSQGQKGAYVDLEFRMNDPSAWSHKISVQLLDADWKLRAQKDLPLRAFVPPTLQKPGASIKIKLAEYFPERLRPGDYKLILVVYDPSTGKRFKNQNGKDFLTLAHVHLP